MRAQQFIPEYERGTDRSRDIERTLRSLGYRRLGGGVESSVWSREAGQVIKIIMPDQTGPDTAMQTFQDFYRLTKKVSSPHWPKFYNMQDQTGRASEFARFLIQGRPYMQIAMERLTGIESVEAYVVVLMGRAVKQGKSWSQVQRHLTRNHSDRVKDYVRENQQQLPDLYSAMIVAHQQGKRLGYVWDLHQGNVMKRSDGTLVITDPWIRWS